MRLVAGENCCLARIIGQDTLFIHFQPIMSVKKKTVFGLEALCRCVDPAGGKIPPGILFELARAEDMALVLDRLCRRKALENYSKSCLKQEDLLLFLNIDVSIIDKGVVGSGNLLNAVRLSGLNPGGIVIEIVESRVKDLAALKCFVERHKHYGFLIALDDVGSGNSNLDRIPLVKPDILKIDRSLVSEIDKKYYKQEVFRSLVNLSRKIGALVVAEGVEREEEAIMVLELGADLLQGYYFAEPRPLTGNPAEMGIEKINYLACKFKSYMAGKINTIVFQHRQYETILNEIMARISGKSFRDFDYYLQQMIADYPGLECAYVLDEYGIQVTDTHCNPFSLPEPGRAFYKPAEKGADHSFKDYYYLLVHTCLNKFTTEPYVSMASGNLCITVSSSFTDDKDDRYILCVDFKQ